MPSGPAIVSGVVRDSSGAPIEGARVMFADGPGSLPDVAALTGTDGGFTLSVPVAGTYRIQCVVEGRAPVAVAVTVAPGESRRVEVRVG
ncbi:MAG: carboxypeptidase-like regulatory domain-containing protein [Vicinamibacterales bacterium]